MQSKLYAILIRLICRRATVQGKHMERITEVYRILWEEAQKSFPEDNTFTLQSTLRTCFARATSDASTEAKEVKKRRRWFKVKVDKDDIARMVFVSGVLGMLLTVVAIPIVGVAMALHLPQIALSALGIAIFGIGFALLCACILMIMDIFIGVGFMDCFKS